MLITITRVCLSTINKMKTKLQKIKLSFSYNAKDNTLILYIFEEAPGDSREFLPEGPAEKNLLG